MSDRSYEGMDHEALLVRIAELEADRREREVNERIAQLSENFGDAPAFLQKVRDIMLSDDGGPALLLSEEGVDQPKRMTATEVVEELLSVMPSKGTVALSEQHQRPRGITAARPSDTEAQTTAEKVAKAREFLGIKDDKPLRAAR